MGVNIKITSGPAIERPGDLAAILTNLRAGDILFIDEIHRFNRAQQDAFLPYVERGDIVLLGSVLRNMRLHWPQKGLETGATMPISPMPSSKR